PPHYGRPEACDPIASRHAPGHATHVLAPRHRPAPGTAPTRARPTRLRAVTDSSGCTPTRALRRASRDLRWGTRPRIATRWRSVRLPRGGRRAVPPGERHAARIRGWHRCCAPTARDAPAVT